MTGIWGIKEEEMITSPKLYAVLPMGPIIKKPQHYGRGHWCTQKGIQIRCFDFLREAPQMGRGMALTVCSSWLTLNYCNPSYLSNLNHKVILLLDITSQ